MEVKIDVSEFNSNIENLQSAASDIESDTETEELDETNIEPFTKDVEKTIDAFELLERYKQMLKEDIHALNNVGETMRENDKQLAKATGQQPIR